MFFSFMLCRAKAKGISLHSTVSLISKLLYSLSASLPDRRCLSSQSAHSSVSFKPSFPWKKKKNSKKKALGYLLVLSGPSHHHVYVIFYFIFSYFFSACSLPNVTCDDHTPLEISPSSGQYPSLRVALQVSTRHTHSPTRTSSRVVGHAREVPYRPL